MRFRQLLFVLVLAVSGYAFQGVDLTGFWQDDTGGKYELRQVGNTLFWFNDGKPMYFNAFYGIMEGSTIRGNWADMPGGQLRNSGALVLRVESANRIVKTGSSGNEYGGSVLTRVGTSAGDGPRCTPIGTWQWVGGQKLIIRGDGSFEVFLSGNKINEGRWVSLGSSRYRLNHVNGGYVDNVTLSGDGKSLQGTNNLGNSVGGTCQPDDFWGPTTGGTTGPSTGGGPRCTPSGTWQWVSGQTLIIRGDGSFEVFQSGNKINEGRWVSLGNSRYQLNHVNGGYVDNVTLSSDGKSLQGTNNLGNSVGGTCQRDDFGGPTTGGSTGAGACTPAGTWQWVQGQTLIMKADGTFEVFQFGNKINEGRWVSLGNSRYQLNHVNGGYVDNVTLSRDGKTLSGRNNLGDSVGGTCQSGGRGGR